eukprot:gnl/TRDRNA2_/TRDRNA2_204235_c0_seq1.p1 gnl/TRDRNA2_/TRDRNA2_204235_c0~~gnl/TRDRNA2_/TRDRNA2_204235_c0_seq1.p1  ORF type:complete len:174 (+),score=25.77 gnl/TRDRNA2_/TRDRNA2_204235_c0_seq1:92-613(+)
MQQGSERRGKMSTRNTHRGALNEPPIPRALVSANDTKASGIDSPKGGGQPPAASPACPPASGRKRLRPPKYIRDRTKQRQADERADGGQELDMHPAYVHWGLQDGLHQHQTLPAYCGSPGPHAHFLQAGAATGDGSGSYFAVEHGPICGLEARHPLQQSPVAMWTPLGPVISL